MSALTHPHQHAGSVESAEALDELPPPPQYEQPAKHTKLGMLWDTFDAPPEVRPSAWPS